ncbi:MAG: hypothetical protein KDB27_33445 [Planctomycetales bacterium]|nr:hypothetical protein [Planctomycetales bacterium]
MLKQYRKTRRTGRARTSGKASLESLEARHMLAGDLMAGDANQDYRFDEADFILSMKSGKFETGEAATWEEGDWNGAPGGTAGAPPAGDGEYNSGDYVAAFVAGTFMQGPYSDDPGPAKNELAPFVTEAAAVRVFYESFSGSLQIESDNALSTFHLASTENIFLGPIDSEIGAIRPHSLPGLFDVYTSGSIFRLDPSGFAALEFNAANAQSVIQPGLSEEFLLNDLRVDGSLVVGGGLGPVSFACVDCFDGVPASASGQLFDDINRNGVRDAGETGIDGLPLKLESLDTGFVRRIVSEGFDANEDGTIDPVTESGRFFANQLTPGAYRVSFDRSEVEFLRTNHVGGFEFTVAEGDVLDITPLGVSRIAPGAIEATAFRDDNGNGTRDADELPLDGVLLRLQDANRAFIGSARSISSDLNQDGTVDPSEAGRFTFSDLTIGDYVVSSAPPTNDWTATTTPEVATTVSEGATTTIEFGFQPPVAGSVQGQVFDDRNMNGQRDPGEPGINGVRIEIFNTRRQYLALSENRDLNNDGTIDPETETGIYSFDVAVVDDYSIRQRLLSGMAQIAPADLLSPVTVSANAATSFDFANFRPIDGDLNLDNVTDVQDIDLLCSTMRGGVYDALMDRDGDQRLTLNDLDRLIEQVFGTVPGDANLDKQFDSGDLVAIWQAGEYEDDIPRNSTWAEGDWNCDGEFDAFDLVRAFRRGGYVNAAEQVEPSNRVTTIGKATIAAAMLFDRDVDRDDITKKAK